MADALEKVKKYVLKVCEIICNFSPIVLLLKNVLFFYFCCFFSSENCPGLKVLSCQKKDKRMNK